MKHLLTGGVRIFALLILLAGASFAQESQRGLFRGDLPSGGRLVIFVQGNSAISAYIFDSAGNQVSLGSASLNPDGTFSLTTNQGETMTGSITGTVVTVTFRGQTFTLDANELFGGTSPISGRFKGWAKSNDGGGRIDVTLLVDSRGNVFLIGNNGQLFGGFGSITLEEGENGDDDPRDDDDKHGNKDPHALKFHGNFSVQTSLGTVRGNFNFNPSGFHGHIRIGSFKFQFHALRDSSEHHLVNISTRGFVQNGDGVLIGGFVIRGGAKLVLIRAGGPSMAQAGVNPVLANPSVRLMRGQTVVAQNDDWQASPRAQQIAASGLAPGNPRESAILMRLEPGPYTAILSGADNGTGIGIIEVFEIDRD